MVFGHIGRRHENRRLSDQAQFRHRSGPGTPDHHVGSGISEVHPVDERTAPDTFRRTALHKFGHLALIEFTGLPDHLQASFGGNTFHIGFHHVVQRARTEAAAHDQYHRLIRFEPEIGQCFGLPCCRVRPFGKTSAQRIARHHDALLRKETLHPLVSHADASGPRCEQLVRHPGVGVLLLDQRRNTHALGAPQHRCARIAAETDHYVGPEAADHATGLSERRGDLERQRQVAGRQPPLQPRHGQPLDAVTQCGNLLHLHLTLGTDEQQFHTVAQPALQRFGHRDRRVDMASRTAAAQNDFYFVHNHTCLQFTYRDLIHTVRIKDSPLRREHAAKPHRLSDNHPTLYNPRRFRILSHIRICGFRNTRCNRQISPPPYDTPCNLQSLR